MTKTKYICGSCNYKFTRSNPPERCPMCGKQTTQKDISRGAQDLIDDITR